MITLFVLTMMLIGFVFGLLGWIIRLGLALLPYILLYQLFRSFVYRRY
ncbi:MAG: hypothetical protein IJL85_03110 [Erysipelotrichaceae bacterium]|nr:hypothetical protein [Erysipelotrichaceae bacterium]